MEKIPTIKLQELANMLYEEPSTSLRNQISAWATSNATNPEHASLSSLCAMAEQSGIKDKILAWVSNLSTPTPEFVYVPDMPAQMIEEKEEIFEGEEESLPKEVEFEIPLSEVIEQPEVAPEIIPEKPKKTRKKKED